MHANPTTVRFGGNRDDEGCTVIFPINLLFGDEDSNFSCCGRAVSVAQVQTSVVARRRARRYTLSGIGRTNVLTSCFWRR